MNNSVIIKSSKYGILLMLDSNVDFETLIRDICVKFSESRKFWGNAHMIISLEGRELSPKETECIVEAIELNSDVKITLIEDKNILRDIRVKDSIDRYYFDEIYDNAKIIKGSIKKNDKLTCERSVVILGDVKKDAIIEAGGNIIVVGCLEGYAYAGYPDDKSMFIVASDFACDLVNIGGVKGEPMMHKKWSLRASKREIEPVGVVVFHDKELLIEPLKSGIIKNVK